jgi:hypothetical protein
VNNHYIESLQDLRAWLKHHLATNIIHRQTGSGGHNGDGTSWAAVAIPDWDIKQHISAIDETLSHIPEEVAR